jgi:translation initiation factor IF-1
MEPPIITTGTIRQQKAEILYSVELINGKTILAHLSKPLTDQQTTFSPNTQVLLEMTPYDFDQGRIIGLAS